MYINCLNACQYQMDGKCTLDKLPHQNNNLSMTNEIDCPYFKRQAVK